MAHNRVKRNEVHGPQQSKKNVPTVSYLERIVDWESDVEEEQPSSVRCAIRALTKQRIRLAQRQAERQAATWIVACHSYKPVGPSDLGPAVQLSIGQRIRSRSSACKLGGSSVTKPNIS
jgi:hypothetical protein